MMSLDIHLRPYGAMASAFATAMLSSFHSFIPSFYKSFIAVALA